jgi:drug/metabolite transporter (DMT)-like permease
MLYYLLLIIATVLFAFQMFFNQQFQRLRGNGLEASLTFSAYVHCVIFFLMLCINGFRMEWSWFSAGLALVRAVMDVAFGYCAIKALSCASLSVYSTFSMLGGMLLPFVYGLAFAEETLTLPKILSCLMISFALFFTVERGKHSKKAIFYYFCVFTLNGLYGVVAAVHQKFPALAVDSQSFSAIASLFTVVLAVLLNLLTAKKFPLLKKPEVKYVGLFGICCGLGNLLLLIALKHVNASVQYPIITGGTMVVSTLICVMRKEKLGFRDFLATAIAFGATVLIIL